MYFADISMALLSGRLELPAARPAAVSAAPLFCAL
eukprot:COSAG02_NODE_17822_length_978_cov_1.564278_3_plen_34_part_01